MADKIIAYKGFNRDMTCRGFKFEVSKTYEHDGPVKACEGGFHACEYPLDVFCYYPPGQSVYAIVEQSGDISRHGDDSKVASRTIAISALIDIAGLVKAAVEWTLRRCNPINPESPASATGDQGAASATGDQGAASATGNYGAASATGDYSVAASLGIDGLAMASETSAIVLCYRDDAGALVHIRSSKVGENGIKAGTWYSLDENGNFVETE